MFHLIFLWSVCKIVYNIKIQTKMDTKNKTDVNGSTDWDRWLLEFETNLKELGYRKYVQNYKNEDFCYWKTFKNGDDKLYQIGVLFYDFRKYAERDPSANRIAVMYQCMLLCDDRIDMDVSKEIDLSEFEAMSKTFYEAMSKYYS